MATRGFVTIATGKERYYNLARNLLYSYRQFASEKYPFAIICDKENAFTQEFDEVILLKNAHCNYLDKLCLYDYLPYDETIFIDADSLAYGDLDVWWEYFKEADDFSCFGFTRYDLSENNGWFNPKGIKEYREKVSFVPDFNGGVYYLRRSTTCKEVFRLANFFSEHYAEYAFNRFDKPADEPVLSLAMAIMGCKTVHLKQNTFVFAPAISQLDADISIPKAVLRNCDGSIVNIRLIHWGNYRTLKSFYRFEAEKVYKLYHNKKINSLLYKHRLRLLFLWVYDIGALIQRIYKKIVRTLSQS